VKPSVATLTHVQQLAQSAARRAAAADSASHNGRRLAEADTSSPALPGEASKSSPEGAAAAPQRLRDAAVRPPPWPPDRRRA
jgi:hypothetical protein